MSFDGDPVGLTQTLVQMDTINPPGNEQSICEYLLPLLQELGFVTALYPFAPGRTNLVATLPATNRQKPPLVLSGHVDTVPLGAAPWLMPPLGGQIEGDRLYGRGSSDMKGGVAAMIAAARRLALHSSRTADIQLVISAAEETGSEGVKALVNTPKALEECGLLVVAEPTDNYPMLGHKGALWTELEFIGVTAHGAMPEQGESALFKACDAVERLRNSDFYLAEHAVLGHATLNMGYLHAGDNLNSVPDSARIGVDLRSIPGQSHERLIADMHSLIDDSSTTIETLVDLPAVYTDPTEPAIQMALKVAEQKFALTAQPRAARYFTDASVLTAFFDNAPTLIMGPGVMTMAHQTDEYCLVSAIRQAMDYYEALGIAYMQA